MATTRVKKRSLLKDDTSLYLRSKSKLWTEATTTYAVYKVLRSGESTPALMTAWMLHSLFHTRMALWQLNMTISPVSTFPVSGSGQEKYRGGPAKYPVLSDWVRFSKTDDTNKIFTLISWPPSSRLNVNDIKLGIQTAMSTLVEAHAILCVDNWVRSIATGEWSLGKIDQAEVEQFFVDFPIQDPDDEYEDYDGGHANLFEGDDRITARLKMQWHRLMPLAEEAARQSGMTPGHRAFVCLWRDVCSLASRVSQVVHNSARASRAFRPTRTLKNGRSRSDVWEMSVSVSLAIRWLFLLSHRHRKDAEAGASHFMAPLILSDNLLRWRTSDVVGLARALQELPFDDDAAGRMAILADALMDAGCEEPEVLSYCRPPAEQAGFIPGFNWLTAWLSQPWAFVKIGGKDND